MTLVGGGSRASGSDKILVSVITCHLGTDSQCPADVPWQWAGAASLWTRSVTTTRNALPKGTPVPQGHR